MSGRTFSRFKAVEVYRLHVINQSRDLRSGFGFLGARCYFIRRRHFVAHPQFNIFDVRFILLGTRLLLVIWGKKYFEYDCKITWTLRVLTIFVLSAVSAALSLLQHRSVRDISVSDLLIIVIA